VASNQRAEVPEQRDELISPGIDETAVDSVLYVEDEFETGNLTAESLDAHLEGMPDDTIFYMSPNAFTALMENRTGQHQPRLYDMPEEERKENEEIPDFVEQGIEEVAEILGNLPAEQGRIDVQVYERNGDPRYLKQHEGEVSDAVFQLLERNLALETPYEVDPTGDGYVLEL
jgi:hypothetical protein